MIQHTNKTLKSSSKTPAFPLTLLNNFLEKYTLSDEPFNPNGQWKAKYVKYKNDPVEMFFDMENDPWEMKNIYDNPKFASEIQHHRTLLQNWEKSLKTILPTKPIVKNPNWIQKLIDIQYGKGNAV